MRMSCNGCRVLRKGCSENCSIRPCLQWLKSPDSQANATVFLAKFYGRAGLLNLINAGPDHLRPAIFRSLLYEACGRMVNPIYGSVGLLWSGSWQLCQAAVEAVLRGAPITQITSEAAVNTHGPPLKPYDIRHVSKDETSIASPDLHKVNTNRSRFKRSAVKPDNRCVFKPALSPVRDSAVELNRNSTSRNSSVSHPPPNVDGESRDAESMVSEETAETCNFFGAEQESTLKPSHIRGADAGLEMVRLELTLGYEPVARAFPVQNGGCGGTCKEEFTL